MKILLDTNVIGEIARPDSPYRANLLSRFNNYSNADFFHLNHSFCFVEYILPYFTTFVNRVNTKPRLFFSGAL